MLSVKSTGMTTMRKSNSIDNLLGLYFEKSSFVGELNYDGRLILGYSFHCSGTVRVVTRSIG